MDIENRPNPEVGNIWAGWIIARIYRAWPLKIDLGFQEILESTKLSVEEGNGSDAFSALMFWLRDEGYIRFNCEVDFGFLDIALTEKTLRVLNAVPGSLSTERLSSRIVDAASDVATEAGKSQLADLFGQLIGGIFKSAVS